MKGGRPIVILTLALCLPRISEATHQGNPAHPATPHSHRRVEHAGVSVEVQVLDAEQTKDIFDTDLIRKDVQPLLIKIHNHSARTYRFRKTNVDAHPIAAAVAARKAYENPVLVGGQLIGRVVTSIPDRIFTSHDKASPRPLLNREIQASFVKEEIPDADVGPHGSLAGLMYIQPRAPGSPTRVTLIDVQTQEPLVFEIPQ